MNSIFAELGPYYTRRAYRMTAEDFWNLHRLLFPHLRTINKPSKPWKNGATNGLILTATRLSVAIRYFAGGRAEDICLVHGIGPSEVYSCVWRVVDAINNCPHLNIKFPTDHGEQRAIAAGFQAKSQPLFPICVGAIDGLLIWTEKPSAIECEKAECGETKFWCGRKKKYGLNLQGTCDHNRRFIDIALGHPASTSDFLCFATSNLQHKLQIPNYLAPGLCLFGDMAYVNTPYMATPFKGVSSGSKDNYNFFHSQLRINIECAFGMLVARWGILRSPLPNSIELKKVTSLVLALCKLHNYCIDCRMEGVPQPLAEDLLEIGSLGGVPIEFQSHGEGLNNENSPEQLLHGGEHNDDTSQLYRKQYARSALAHSQESRLPRDRLHEDIVAAGNFERPAVQW